MRTLGKRYKVYCDLEEQQLDDASAPMRSSICDGEPSALVQAGQETSGWWKRAIGCRLAKASAVRRLIEFIRRTRLYRSQRPRQAPTVKVLDEVQNRLLRMIDDMPVAVMTVDPQTFRITYVNETSKSLIRTIEHLLPLKAGELLGASIDVFHRHPEHQRRILADPENLPHNARISLGSEVLDLKVSAIIDDDGSYLGPMLTWAIVTKEVQAEHRIRHLAHHDPLTGLNNRTSFNQKLEEALADRTSSTGFMLLDIDGFKLVNDTLGHNVGDRLLQQVATRLRGLCDSSHVTIGRLGGDEFAILLPGFAPDEIAFIANRVIAGLAPPYELASNQHVLIGASAGIAIAPLDGSDGETLARRADLALYAAKQAGKGVCRTFSAAMERKIHEKQELQAALRHALCENAGLFVFYQPIVDAVTGKICAREALVRWHLGGKGWIAPDQFIPIAEESDLIDLLGQFVLNTACADAVAFPLGERVAVNVSAAQLGKGKITGMVLAALAHSGLSPDRLEIEVTETAILADEHGGLSDLRRIQEMGVRIALDDFGTGYSSLTHLCSFPFDKIKIDGSFVRTALDRPASAAIVSAIADLGKRLGVETVAEGVETTAHFEFVLNQGCNSVQGYLLGQPAPLARDAARLARVREAASVCRSPSSRLPTD